MQDIQDLKVSFFLLFVELKCQGKARGNHTGSYTEQELESTTGKSVSTLGSTAPAADPHLLSTHQI